MKSKIDILLLGMVIALMIGGIASSEAAAVEAPYWSLGGKRLSQGEHEAISIKGTDPPDIVFVVVNGPVITNVFVTAENIFFVGGSILGSYPFSDGKAEGTMKFEKPSLWAKASSGKYEEQTKCIVEEFQSKPLAGQMFLEGKREETQKPVLQFESIKSQKGEETRSLLAEITIKAKGGKAGECQPIGESTSKTYKLEGKFGGQIRPEQTETVVTNIIYPEKPVVHVWQPLTQFVAEETLGLSVEGNTAALTGEFETN
jgi:hypothetical protein